MDIIMCDKCLEKVIVSHPQFIKMRGNPFLKIDLCETCASPIAKIINEYRHNNISIDDLETALKNWKIE